MKMLLVMHEFRPGGVASLYSDIGREGVSQGHGCVIVAAGAPSESLCDWGGVEVRSLPRWDAAGVDRVLEVAEQADLTVCALTPETAPLFPALTAVTRVVLSMHGARSVMEQWLGAQALRAVREGISLHPGTPLFAFSLRAAMDLASLFGGRRGQWRVLPHVTSAVRGPNAAEPSARRRDYVLCPGRISPDRASFVVAAGGLAAVRRMPLKVVGAAGDTEEVRRRLAAIPGLDFSLVDDPNLRPWLDRSGLVVAAGITALEALAARCDLVVPSRAVDGGIFAVACPDNWRALHEQNFVGLDATTITPEEASRRVESITDRERDALDRLVRRDAHPTRALEAIIAAGEISPPAHRENSGARLLAALAAGWLDARAEQIRLFEAWSELQEWTGRLVEARDYHNARAERLEQALQRRESD